ncbi:hypothetical protein DEU56DRAFT_754750 [Suillus clintonianus]|uniref:uncharacterized protein n=1 Tax=Suillus clintonianus TaxID=1904413 RepID=UPI001B88052D|nr:uncharacterized protein DEU56DRAFT_754750 [Suillus clintonianus]KAG2142415.1 hypothetical protein DEU56DRAFT_754750 [Suillus clintonianus]
MPAIREHDIYLNDIEEDDGMPPLVDNPNTSMTFTFFTDMTPITAFSVDPTAPCENAWDTPASASPVEFADSLDCPTTQTTDRVSHGKKRDASYIPRPPNAFILFRSSFIRSQQVPEKVEGNHSTLSKIIGKYWKTLPREEREIWEAKALVAQAEHRKRYPDWRFRPGANALAKLKVKDGPGIANRRRSTQSTKKGRGNADSKKKNKSKDERCSMIADLLVEGKTGAELESALRNWENGISREVEGAVGREGEHDHEGGDEGNWGEAFPPTNHFQMESAQCSQGFYHPGHTTQVNTDGRDHPATSQPRCKTPHDDRFQVPLTAMFKRSLSAPARRFATPSDVSGHSRNNSLTSNFTDVLSDTASSPPSVCSPSAFPLEQYEDPSVAVYGDSMGHLSPLVLPSGLGDSSPARWNDPYNLLGAQSPIGSFSDCPSLSYGHSPSVSPVDMSFGNYTYPSPTLAALTATKPDNISAGLDYPISYDTQCYSSYSALKGWADGQYASFDAFPEGPVPQVFVNQYASTPAIYEWSPLDDTIRAGQAPQLHNTFESSSFNFGF